MKVNSDNRPEQFIESRDKLFFNFNIIESEKTDEQGKTRTSFEYEAVEVKDRAKDTIIAAIMRDKYTIDSEIALINNKFKNGNNKDTEYDDYQAMRATVKVIAKEL